MKKCSKCGQTINFITNPYGQKIPIHRQGSCSNINGNISSLKQEERYKVYSSFVNPNANCPICHRKVFFYQSENGGSVFFDELGPPWPKHKCTDRLQQKPDIPLWLSEGWKPLFLSRYEKGRLVAYEITQNQEQKNNYCFKLLHEFPSRWASDWEGEPIFYKRINKREFELKSIITVKGKLVEVELHGKRQ